MSVLREMFENLIGRPVTVLYPREKVPIPEAFRGRVAITDDKCIGCSKCSLVCPAQVITMIDGPREVEFRGKNLARKKRPQVKLYLHPLRPLRAALPDGAIHLEQVHAVRVRPGGRGHVMHETERLSETCSAG